MGLNFAAMELFVAVDCLQVRRVNALAQGRPLVP
jgi:hypothetical protein